MYLQGLEYKQYKTRIQWIDIARCISIAIIVYAHIYDDGVITDFVHVFHVPVFFILSGLVWKQAEEMKTLLRRLLINLVIPYFIVGLVSIVAYQIMGSFFTMDKLSLGQCLKGILYANSRTGLMKWNRPLWFIPCLVVVRIVWELISRLKREPFQYITVAIIVALGVITLNTSFVDYKLPWEIEVAVHALLYFTVGVVVNRHTSACNVDFVARIPRIRMIPVVAISLGICAVVYRFNPSPISFQYNHYGIYPLFVLGSLFGTILVGGVALLIGKRKVFEVIGQNTLGILLWHKFPVLIFQATSLGKRCVKEPDSIKSIIVGLVVLVISIMASIYAGLVARKITTRINRFLNY